MSWLWADFLTNGQRVIHKWAHYFPIYERHFSRFVDRSVLLIEIGVSRGGSLQLWKRFLGPFAVIVGVDINPQCKQFEEEQITIRIGDQSDPVFLQSLIDEFGAPDVVLDDGSHLMRDVQATFAFLYSRLSKNGVYMVEDMHTAYWDEYGGGLNSPNSFIETCKRLIDELNADHSRGALEPTEFTKTTMAMHLYDSVVVFERGQHVKKRDFATGGADLFQAFGSASKAR